jgi:hypothetical protein
MIAQTEPTIEPSEYSNTITLTVTYVYLRDSQSSAADYKVGSKRVTTTDSELVLRVAGDYLTDDDGTRDEIIHHKIPFDRIEKRIKKSIRIDDDRDPHEVDL